MCRVARENPAPCQPRARRESLVSLGCEARLDQRATMASLALRVTLADLAWACRASRERWAWLAGLALTASPAPRERLAPWASPGSRETPACPGSSVHLECLELTAGLERMGLQDLLDPLASPGSRATKADPADLDSTAPKETSDRKVRKAQGEKNGLLLVFETATPNL